MAGVEDAFRGQISQELLDDLIDAINQATGSTPITLIVYTNATRPAANTFTSGTMIWNSSDKAPNFAGGPTDTNWYDSAGNIT